MHDCSGVVCKEREQVQILNRERINIIAQRVDTIIIPGISNITMIYMQNNHATFISEVPGEVVESRGQMSILSSLQFALSDSLMLDTLGDSAQLMLSGASSFVPSAPVVELGTASLMEAGVGNRVGAMGGGVMNTFLTVG